MAQLKHLLQQQYSLYQAPEALAPDPATMRRFLEHCTLKRYQNKTTILRHGAQTDTLYYIIEGSVSVCSEDEEGRELVLSYINRGQFVGEMGLFLEQAHPEILVRTRSDCKLAEIRYERLFELFTTSLKEECPKLMFAVGFQLANRLKRLSLQATRMAFLDVTQRIMGALLELCEEPDAMSHPDGTQIKVSRVELCRIVSCSREMAGRVLKELEAEGMIRVSGKTIVVCNVS